MEFFRSFDAAWDALPKSGGAMNYDQDNNIWAVGTKAEISKLSNHHDVERPAIDPIGKSVTCVEIDDDDIQDGGISDQLLAELGLVDVTYSKPEFRYDCEMNNGFTLGYYEAGDKTIFRLDLMGNDLELNQVSTEKLEELVTEYDRSTK